MSRTKRRISGVYSRARRVEIDDTSRFVLFSDLHRGRGSRSDDFAKNQKLYETALAHYWREGYTYLELGDGDELWQERRMAGIIAEYPAIFQRLADFHRAGRLYMLSGNHDVMKSNPAWVRVHLEPLFPGLVVEEGVLLVHTPTGHRALLLHGHQADFFNDRLWRLGRFLVRYIWRPMELIGLHNPFEAADNPKRRTQVERDLEAWANARNTSIIAGHTHRPYFPRGTTTRYYNTGSAVHDRYITAIEINTGLVMPVKWEVGVREDGGLFITKELLTPSVEIQEIFA
ncbi:MAG: metallophosphoesterase family protein [Oscillospiraceae bacterium]|nr:metallophosphoesterase family protein [Oscillospiraceae bacterium]